MWAGNAKRWQILEHTGRTWMLGKVLRGSSGVGEEEEEVDLARQESRVARIGRAHGDVCREAIPSCVSLCFNVFHHAFGSLPGT